MLKEWKGIIAVPVTPFNSSNELDVEILRQEVDYIIERKVSRAISYPMHFSEALEMSDAERRRSVEVVIERANGKIPVIVHVSSPGTDNALGFARHARDTGADAIISTIPYNWGPTPDGIRAHFERLSSIGISLFAYNPSPSYYSSQAQIPTQIIFELASKHENLVGMKDASWNMEYFIEAVRLSTTLSRNFSILAGIEHLVPTMAVGGSGAFSALGLVFPNLLGRLYQLCERGAFIEARPLQFKVSKLLLMLKQYKMHPTVKAIMEMQGRPAGLPRLPNTPLSATEKEAVLTTLKQIGVWETESWS